MIRCLKVRNFGVIEEVDVEFGPGLTVVTGETGAGKSMLLDALMLLSGGRADSGVLRAGCDEASVEGVFEGTPELSQRLEERGLGAGDEVLIRRTVSAQGRGRAWVNGNLVTVTVLEQVMRGLVDLAGQLEHASLFDEDSHRSLVDRFGQVEEPRAAYAARWLERQSVLRKLQALGGDENEARARAGYLEFQVDELVAAAVKPGELAALDLERRRLSGAARLEGLASVADDLLATRDVNASDLVREAAQRLAEMEKLDPSARPIRERVAAALAELDESTRLLSRYLSALERNPGRLREVEDRLDLVQALARKHGVGPEALAGRAQALAEELDLLRRRAELRAAAERELAEADRQLTRAATQLTQARRVAAGGLERKIGECLERLALKNARFSVELVEAPPSATGADALRFLFSANPGEPARPLSKVASGGEASRVMLAIKAVLAATERVSVSVLDEVDTGVGGAIADVVGRLIKDLSAHRQVLCITHLPQVAAHAQCHLRIEKRRVGQRVHSSIELLNSLEARSNEVARMLSGVEISKEARAAAQVLITSAAMPDAPGKARRKSQLRANGERRTA
jgi:DNA repair protein RecN (Recombination protein N)